MRPLSSHVNPRLDLGFFSSLPEGVQRANPYYWFMRQFLQATVTMLWKVRVFDRYHEPPEGGAVYICNHQSFLDPIVMSFALRRPMNYMARESLFHFRPFGCLIRRFNAFPVKRGTADLGAIKEAMRRLKAGSQVVVFAEGTRTLDGRIGPFLPGVAVLAQRAAAWTVPVVIDGAFEAWPRWRAIPSPGSVVVRYAPPIPQREASAMSAEELTNRVRNVLIDMQRDIRRRVGRPELKYEEIRMKKFE